MKAGSKGRKEEEARKGGMEGRKVREGRMEGRKEGRKDGKRFNDGPLSRGHGGLQSLAEVWQP